MQRRRLRRRGVGVRSVLIASAALAVAAGGITGIAPASAATLTASVTVNATAGLGTIPPAAIAG